MPASKLNYLVVYNNSSQVYGSASKKIAVETPPPEGSSQEDKNVFFITLEPDTGNICLHKIQEENQGND